MLGFLGYDLVNIKKERCPYILIQPNCPYGCSSKIHWYSSHFDRAKMDHRQKCSMYHYVKWHLHFIHPQSHSALTVAQSGHLYFQTSPVTEFTTCETAISYLTQNLLPVKQQSPISHRVYHLIICNVVGDIRFTTSNTTIFYFTQDFSVMWGKTSSY